MASPCSKPRKRRSPLRHTRAENARVMALLEQHLLAGGEPKAFWMEYDRGPGWVYGRTHKLGYHSMMVTNEERTAIIAQRRARLPGLSRAA